SENETADNGQHEQPPACSLPTFRGTFGFFFRLDQQLNFFFETIRIHICTWIVKSERATASNTPDAVGNGELLEGGRRRARGDGARYLVGNKAVGSIMKRRLKIRRFGCLLERNQNRSIFV